MLGHGCSRIPVITKVVKIMNPVKLLIIGAGGRGGGYATYAAEHPDLAKVVGVAEPRDFYRNRLVETYGIP